MVALTLFVNKTKVGHAMQAVSEDKGAAQLMGINVNATISLTFAIGSALAAVAGVLLCSAYPTLMPTTVSYTHLLLHQTIQTVAAKEHRLIADLVSLRQNQGRLGVVNGQEHQLCACRLGLLNLDCERCV